MGSAENTSGGRQVVEKLPRRERERREHVRHILEVARGLFAERGFFKVTMKEIAERAEFALGTVYSFFQGKRNLYRQAVEQKLDELVASVSRAIADETSPVLVVKRFIEAKLRFFFENRDFARLYFAEIYGLPLSGEPGLSFLLRDKHGVLLERVSKAIEKGMSDGIFAKASPDLVVTALDGQISAFVFSWFCEVSPDSPEREIEAAERIFLNGVLATRGDSVIDGEDHR